ncbi:MAG: hypothetical protein FJ109_10285 [Deltaproteobacteria bacterium]|nr:hypothetical protein [Deltaproteobacteria bacterium]
MLRHYDGVARDAFFSDLAEKDHVLLFTVGGNLIGFSTIFCRRLPRICDAVFLFSGDTVIEKPWWGGSFLQMAFGRYVLAVKLRNLHRPVYWMLISKAYKTYMMMRRNYPYSFPQHGRPMPDDIRRALVGFYDWKYPGALDPQSGIIRLEQGGYAVCGGLAEPDESAAADRDVRYFLERNPGWSKGDELACLAEIRLRDYLAILRKYVPRYVKLMKG